MTLKPEQKWRLVLGEAADESLHSLDASGAAMDAALAWLYRHEGKDDGRDVMDRQGGEGASVLSVPDWIDQVHKLFPKETIERMEGDAVERYQLHEVVTRPDVLARVQPSQALLGAVLKTKHLMNPEVLALARELVRKVVQQLMDKLQTHTRTAFAGVVDRRKRSPVPMARNFDFKATLRTHLKRYDPVKRRILLERPLFFSRVKRHVDPWQVILLVDQSGSMTSSVIHSAVTAACLWGLPGIKTHLIAFDTAVVDLTNDAADPVELLMKVQLGGGTDIGQAVHYASQLVETPRRTILVLITDFFEGTHRYPLVPAIRGLCASGVTVLGLAALDDQANPAFDRDMAQGFANAGAHVGAMTPGELATFIADKVRRP